MDRNAIKETNVDEETSIRLNDKQSTEPRMQIFQKEYQIVAEYKMLQNENLSNIYVIPSSESSFLWFGVLFLHEGMYSEAIFRFNIIIPESFPDNGQPTVIFQSKIYHPHIDENTGVLDISIGFPNWKFSDHHVWQLLKYMKWIFHNPDSNARNEPLNKEALDLLRTNKLEFMEKIKQSVELSLQTIYDPPPTNDKHYITFESYNEAVHEPIRELIRNDDSKSLPGTLTDNRSSGNLGLSWIQRGTFRPLSKVNSDESS